MAARGTWIVLGASSAIARAFAAEAAAAGHRVILAGRDLEDLERTARDLALRFRVKASILRFDAAAPPTHPEFVQDCLGRADGPISLFLAFGVMAEQAAIDADPALVLPETLATMQTTYVGAVSVLSLFAPHLEAQRAGRVVVLGSVAGDRGRRRNCVYGSAKAGLHVFLAGLRARLARAGVGVTTVKPGFVDTAMTWGLPGLFLVARPGDLARACLRAAARGRSEMYFPWFWRPVMLVLRAMPERLFARLDL